MHDRPFAAGASRALEGTIKDNTDARHDGAAGWSIRASRPVPRNGPATTDEDTWRTAPQWQQTAQLRWQRRGSLKRLVVCASHPGDATFAAGGFIATASHFGAQIEILVLTAGEASHPHSPTHTPAALAERHEYESTEAIAILAPGVRPIFLGLSDGQIALHVDAVAERLTAMLTRDSDNTLVIAPYRHDGWPDHDATGLAAAKVAADAGVMLWEMPVELWQWGAIDDVPWPDLCRFRLARGAFADKIKAIACFTSLLHPLSGHPVTNRPSAPKS